jgi:hypothetical protein
MSTAHFSMARLALYKLSLGASAPRCPLRCVEARRAPFPHGLATLALGVSTVLVWPQLSAAATCMFTNFYSNTTKSARIFFLVRLRLAGSCKRR